MWGIFDWRPWCHMLLRKLSRSLNLSDFYLQFPLSYRCWDVGFEGSAFLGRGCLVHSNCRHTCTCCGSSFREPIWPATTLKILKLIYFLRKRMQNNVFIHFKRSLQLPSLPPDVNYRILPWRCLHDTTGTFFEVSYVTMHWHALTTLRPGKVAKGKQPRKK